MKRNWFACSLDFGRDIIYGRSKANNAGFFPRVECGDRIYFFIYSVVPYVVSFQ